MEAALTEACTVTDSTFEIQWHAAREREAGAKTRERTLLLTAFQRYTESPRPTASKFWELQSSTFM